MNVEKIPTSLQPQQWLNMNNDDDQVMFSVETGTFIQQSSSSFGLLCHHHIHVENDDDETETIFHFERSIMIDIVENLHYYYYY